jgi:hypothetical protein
MARTKMLTPKFLAALFRRGKSEYLPLGYLIEEAQKVLADGEAQKIPAMLTDLADKGLIEANNEEYKITGELS